MTTPQPTTSGPVPSRHLALVHHPIVDQRGALVTTAVTSIDLHDIARSCRTFGVRTFWVVTPVEAMWRLTERILGHWREGWGVAYNPSRGEALGTVRLVNTLGEAIDAITNDDKAPAVVGTSAQSRGVVPVTIAQAAQLDPLLLVFGTGNGLAPAALDMCQAMLPPIAADADYNHLSVRSAAAIYLNALHVERRVTMS